MDDHQHDDHRVNYMIIFFALCGFTVLSVASDVAKDLMSYGALIVVVLAIASAKAACVMLYFMHLKFEGNWKFIILAPTTILAIGLPLALLPDVGLHYYMDTAEQRQWRQENHQSTDNHGPTTSTEPEHE
ncbi:MAG: cytochrome C oxidase subunit IV family protein [Planctomycetaceae bacterium]